MSIYDGFFEIRESDDGIYIDLYPSTNDGKSINVDDVINELSNRGIEGYDVNKIISEVSQLDEQRSIRVVNKVNDNLDEETRILKKSEQRFDITVSQDKMHVFVAFYPFDEEKAIKKQDIISLVSSLGIVVEVINDILEEVLSEYEYNVPYEIAAGKQPIDGTPDSIKYFFKTKKDLAPEIDAEGNVNYHKLHLVSNVKKEQLLAELTQGSEGFDGIDVFGNVVPAKNPKPVRLLRGKNTYLEENNTKLFASVDGMVRIDDNKIVVNESYNVANNVGVSTGDIEFNGTVIVSGNISSGFKVIAKGDVEVMGVIESAVVEAGGNIIAHRGIQGGSNCKIRAKGDLNTKYIENADVRVGGTIHSEAILHSNVSASDEITVDGKKGMISGGVVRSGIKINAKTLGSHMGTATSIEVGIDPFVWEEYNQLKKDLPKMKEELTKLDQVIGLLNKKKELEGPLDEKKQEMYVSATRNKIFLANKINNAEKKFAELGELVAIRNDGKVVAKGTVYSGVKVTIGSAIYYIRDSIQYVEMVKNGADIKLNSL
jgi:uncharacterized protein